MFGCVRNDSIMCPKNKIILFAKYYICVDVNRQSCYLKICFICKLPNFKLDETVKLAGN